MERQRLKDLALNLQDLFARQDPAAEAASPRNRDRRLSLQALFRVQAGESLRRIFSDH